MLSLPRCFAASAIVVVFALAVPTVVRGTPRPQLFPNTREGIHLAQVFNYLIPDPRTEIGKVDIVWGASAPIPQSVLNSYYIPFDRDGAAGPGHTLAWWRAHHPDWIEYKCDRKTVAFEFGEKNVPIDIANSAVIAFQMTREATPQLAAGYRGIAWDNVNLNNGFARCGHFALGGKWVQQFTGNSQDPAYEAAVLQWAKTVLVDIHAYSNAVTMWINYSYDTSASYAMNLQLYESTDLLLDESGVTNYGQKRHNRPDPQTWADIFHSVREAEKAGICYEMNGEEPFASPEIPTSERLWVVANYLLFKGGCTYVSISGFSRNLHQQDYGRLLQYPEYGLPIGHSIGAPQRSGAAWLRNYSGGLAIVNPSARPVTVPVSQQYFDDDGNVVSGSVQLGPQSGTVLLTSL